MRPEKFPESHKLLTSSLQVKNQFWEVKFIKPLYSLYQFVYMFEETCKCWNQSLKMPKATKSGQHEQHTIEYVLPEETSEQEETSSDQEQEDEVVIQSPQFMQPSTSQSQVVQPMYMPYIYRGQNGLDCEWRS